MQSFLSPQELAERIRDRARMRRLHINMTQRELAERAGVSYGSVKRFEQTEEISLKNLLRIAIVLDAADEFESLFHAAPYQSVSELVESKKKKQKKRARGSDT